MQRMMWVMALVAVLGVGAATTDSAQQAAAQDVVDLNSATAVQLETLMNVRGICERSFLRLRPLVTVGAASGAGEDR